MATVYRDEEGNITNQPPKPQGFERRRLRVYVAGPISSDPMRGVHRGFEAGRQMFLDGMAPFIPQADAFWFLGEGHWNAYLEYDLEYVSVCDALYRLDGPSKGADLEVKVAEELGIPVFLETEYDSNGFFTEESGYQRLIRYAVSKNLAGVRK